MKLKPRQVAILQAARRFYEEHGYAASLIDLWRITGVSSTSVVQYNLLVLERAGLMQNRGYVDQYHSHSRGWLPVHLGRVTLRCPDDSEGGRWPDEPCEDVAGREFILWPVLG